MSMTSQARRMAYDAGRAMRFHDGDGIEHCPFPEGDPQRDEWLKGYADSLDEAPDPKALQRQLRGGLSEEAQDA